MAGPSNPPAAASGPQNNFAAIGAPTAANDATQGYAVGSLWLRPATGEEWRCRDATAGAARWVRAAVTEHPGYAAGRRYLPGLRMAYGSTCPGNQAYSGAPIRIRQRITIDQLGVRALGIDSGCQISLALYAFDVASGLPLALAAKTPTAAAMTAQAPNYVATDPGSVIEPGTYIPFAQGSANWASFVVDGYVNEIAATVGDATGSGFASDISDNIAGWYFVNTFNAWPASLSGVSLTRFNGPGYTPVVGFRVGSVGP